MCIPRGGVGDRQTARINIASKSRFYTGGKGPSKEKESGGVGSQAWPRFHGESERAHRYHDVDCQVPSCVLLRNCLRDVLCVWERIAGAR